MTYKFLNIFFLTPPLGAGGAFFLFGGWGLHGFAALSPILRISGLSVEIADEQHRLNEAANISLHICLTQILDVKFWTYFAYYIVVGLILRETVKVGGENPVFRPYLSWEEFKSWELLAIGC